MPSFHEVRLPEDIDFGVTGGPRFKTTIFESAGGFEQRNIDWSQARAEYTIGKNLNDETDLATLIAFFNARRGRAYGFRFKDFSDFQISGPQTIGTGDGSTTDFQIFKQYSSGGEFYNRPITKLVSGTVQVYLDGMLQGSGFTVDNNTGIVTFTAAPTMGVLVGIVCEFDVPVRFDVDALPIEIASFRNFIADGLPLVEIRIV